MLHCMIDLVPFGNEEGRRQIWEVYIGNNGEVDYMDIYDYVIYLKDPRMKGKKKRPSPDATCHHSRADGAAVLIAKAIQALKEKGKI